MLEPGKVRAEYHTKVFVSVFGLNWTTIQVVQGLLEISANQRARLCNETEEEREARLQRMRDRVQDETEEEREARLQRMRDRVQDETEEEREARLQRMSAYK